MASLPTKHTQPTRALQKWLSKLLGLNRRRNKLETELRIENLEPRWLFSLSSLIEELVPADRPVEVRLAGIDQDERRDLVALDQDGSLTIAVNQVDDAWESINAVNLGVGTAQGFQLVDWNQDAAVDILLQTPDSLVLAFGDGQGAFQVQESIAPAAVGDLAPSDGSPVSLTVGLLDGDFYADAAVVVPGANEVLVLRGNQAGTLGSVETYGSGGSDQRCIE